MDKPTDDNAARHLRKIRLPVEGLPALGEPRAPRGSLRGAAAPFVRRAGVPEAEWDALVAEAAAEDYLRKTEE